MGSYEEAKLEELKSEIFSLPAKLETILEEKQALKEIAEKIYTEHDMYFLGRGTDYHGTIALIENGITVVGILTNPDLTPKSISNLQEVVSRGAKTLVVTNQELTNVTFDYVIRIPEVNSLISPILSVVPLQLLAYYISKAKGLDVDKPRNLAKSVTVE